MCTPHKCDNAPHTLIEALPHILLWGECVQRQCHTCEVCTGARGNVTLVQLVYRIETMSHFCSSYSVLKISSCVIVEMGWSIIM